MDYQQPPQPFESAGRMNQSPQRIVQLEEGFSPHPIVVLIRNIWELKNNKTISTQSCTGFLCYDAKGQSIEGFLSRNIQPNHPKYITEGDVYVFSRFTVLLNSRDRKLTQLQYYIRIDNETTVSNITGIAPIFPLHNLSPQKYKSLVHLATTPTYLPDVMGEIYMVHKTKPPEMTIGLLLHGSKRVRLTLTDKQADEFTDLHRKKDRRYRVVIITSIIPKLYNGKLQLKSSPATTFFFDKSIDCIKHFTRWLRNQERS